MIEMNTRMKTTYRLENDFDSNFEKFIQVLNIIRKATALQRRMYINILYIVLKNNFTFLKGNDHCPISNLSSRYAEVFVLVSLL